MLYECIIETVAVWGSVSDHLWMLAAFYFMFKIKSMWWSHPSSVMLRSEDWGAQSMTYSAALYVFSSGMLWYALAECLGLLARWKMPLPTRQYAWWLRSDGTLCSTMVYRCCGDSLFSLLISSIHTDDNLNQIFPHLDSSPDTTWCHWTLVQFLCNLGYLCLLSLSSFLKNGFLTDTFPLKPFPMSKQKMCRNNTASSFHLKTVRYKHWTENERKSSQCSTKALEGLQKASNSHSRQLGKNVHESLPVCKHNANKWGVSQDFCTVLQNIPCFIFLFEPVEITIYRISILD